MRDGRVYQGLSSTFRSDTFADFVYPGETRVLCVRGDVSAADFAAAGFPASRCSEGGRIFKVAAERVEGVLCFERHRGKQDHVWGVRDGGCDGVEGCGVADRPGAAGDDRGRRDRGVNRELQAFGEEVS